jgi:hypothetical protein
MLRRLALLLLVLPLLGGCGGDFMTSTPSYARFDANEILKDFRAAGLRVDGTQDLPRANLGADAPPFRQAKSFAAGKPGSSTTATLFTFDTPADLTAMEEFIQKKYAKKQRMIPYRNVILVFWIPDVEDSGDYDPVLLGMQ